MSLRVNRGVVVGREPAGVVEVEGRGGAGLEEGKRVRAVVGWAGVGVIIFQEAAADGEVVADQEGEEGGVDRDKGRRRGIVIILDVRVA
jgi:hypothetical protein